MTRSFRSHNSKTFPTLLRIHWLSRGVKKHLQEKESHQSTTNRKEQEIKREQKIVWISDYRVWTGTVTDDQQICNEAKSEWSDFLVLDIFLLIVSVSLLCVTLCIWVMMCHSLHTHYCALFIIAQRVEIFSLLPPLSSKVF